MKFRADAGTWRRAVAVVCALAASLAAAQPADAPAASPAGVPSLLAGALQDGRLDVGYALSSRSGTLSDGALAARFGGFSPSHLRLEGAAFLRTLPLGVAADLAREWYAATGPNLLGVEETHGLAGTRGALALAGRLRPLPALAVEGQLGYGFGALPFLDASEGKLRALSLGHHGPLLGATLQLDAGGPLQAQLSARLMPVSLGAGSALGDGRLVHAAVGAQLGAGGWQLGGARWHATLGYTLELSTGTTGKAHLTQTAHRFGLGLRASFGEPPGATAPSHTEAPSGVRGQVTYGDTGEPASGVEVAVAGGPTLLTDAQGAFTVPAAGPGPLALSVRAAGYQTAAQTVVLPAGGGAADVALVLARATGPGTIRGTVRLAVPGGEPTPAADVQVESPGLPPVRTGPDGTFTLGPVGPGPVPVAVRAAGRKPAEEVVSVPPGGEAPLELVLEASARRAPASLRGEVRNAAGRPVAAATVRVPEVRASARSDRQGRFQLRLLPGRYTVVFAARGYVTQTRVLEVAEGDQAIFHVRLVPLEP